MVAEVSPRKLLNFYLDPDLVDGLKALKQRLGVSEAETVRRAVRKHLEDQDVIKKAERKRAVTRRRP